MPLLYIKLMYMCLRLEAAAKSDTIPLPSPNRGKPHTLQMALDGEHGVRSAFNIKMSKYDERCAAEGITFIPLAVDSFGGWHGAALDVFSKLGRQLSRSRQLGKEEEEVTRKLRQRLSII